MKWLMRSNNYESDPLSKGNPLNAISSRGDLIQNQTLSKAFGGIDCKIVNYYMIGNYECIISSGPTTNSDPISRKTNKNQKEEEKEISQQQQQLSPFSWKQGQWKSYPSGGMPSSFDFDWLEIQS